MTERENTPFESPAHVGFSYLWDIYIPISIAAVPASMFSLLGVVTAGMDKPGVKLPTWMTVTMIVLQTTGIVCMAFVILSRLEFRMNQLDAHFAGHPAAWRRLCLLMGMGFLALFDILTNVGAAFSGAGFLILAAIPMFVAYLLCIRVTFFGLHRATAAEPE